MAVKTKTPRRKAQSRLTQELLETARDMHVSGLMTKAAHDKITKRHLGTTVPSTTPAMLNGKEIKALRERFHLSQAVFAHLLNLTTGYVLERDAKRPSGPALVLLDIIRRKGIDAIL
jgi:putative transcriptional regulator